MKPISEYQAKMEAIELQFKKDYYGITNVTYIVSTGVKSDGTNYFDDDDILKGLQIQAAKLNVIIGKKQLKTRHLLEKDREEFKVLQGKIKYRKGVLEDIRRNKLIYWYK